MIHTYVGMVFQYELPGYLELDLDASWPKENANE